MTTQSLSEQVIESTIGDTLYYYGFQVTLTQANVPYVVSSSFRPVSQYHLVVCADVITIGSTLTNPGMNLAFYARQVVFEPGAVLDVSGPDPATTYAPGVPAQQTLNAPGSAGASGVSASGGTSAGTITIVAESILGASPAPGSMQISTVDWSTLQPAMQQAIAANALVWGGSAAVPLPSLTLQMDANALISAGSATFTNLQLTGDMAATSPGSVVEVDNAANQATVDILLANIALNAAVELNIQWKNGDAPEQSGVIENASCSLQATVVLGLDASHGVSVVSASVVLTFSGFVDSLSGFNVGGEAALWSLEAKLAAALGEQLQTNVASVLTTAACLGSDATLAARGGVGGRGQDGNAGIIGVRGVNGQDSDYTCNGGLNCDPPASTYGQQGGQGGQGGSAGPSGTGGSGGSINIEFVVPTSVRLACSAAGGDGGAAASAGAPGPGGAGGVPGTYLIWDGGSDTRTVPSTAGVRGLAGPVAAFTGAPGATGVAGTLSVNGNAYRGGSCGATTYAAISPYFPPEQLLITQRCASLAFLAAQTQDDYQTVLQLLLWLTRITAPALAPGFAPAGWQTTDIAAAQQINALATSLISYMQAGLDFYGHPASWVPIVTLANYEITITALLTLGENIEIQLNDYAAQDATASQQLAALTLVQTNLNNNITSLQTQITDIGEEITTLAFSIAEMNAQLQAQQTLIAEDAETFTEDFQNYVANDTGCTFSEALTAVTVILQLGTGLLDGVGLISGAYAAENALDTGAKQFKYAISIVQKISSTVTMTSVAVKAGIAAVQAALPSPNPGGVIGVLATDQTQFDTFIAQYVGKYGSAAALQQAVDEYFAMINALNGAIATYNGLYITQATLTAQLALYQTQLEQLAAQLAVSQPNPTLPVCVSFIQSAYAGLKANIVQMLYAENRAYYYWSLVDVPFSTDDLTIATLSQTHADILEKMTAAQEALEQAAQTFTEQVTISAANYPFAFAKLSTSHQQLVFSIDPTVVNFQNMYQVNVDTFKLAFPDITVTSGVLSVTLSHPGTSYVVGTDGTQVQFTHTPRSAPYKIDYGNSINTGGGVLGAPEQDLIGLSPFTQWTLDFDENGNQWLDLSDIKSVVVTFSGSYLGPVSAVAAATRQRDAVAVGD